MKQEMGLTGEASDHKVAGIFSEGDQARSCAEKLLASMELSQAQVVVLKPGDTVEGSVLEPESRGIWHTLIRAHVWLALAGAVVGLIVFFLLLALDVAFAVDNRAATLIALVAFCTIGGAMLGGAVTLRPDHAPYLVKVREALNDQRHVVLVHATDQGQMQAAKDTLDQQAEETVSTL